jgi:hypothetical protein
VSPCCQRLSQLTSYMRIHIHKYIHSYIHTYTRTMHGGGEGMMVVVVQGDKGQGENQGDDDEGEGDTCEKTTTTESKDLRVFRRGRPSRARHTGPTVREGCFKCRKSMVAVLFVCQCQKLFCSAHLQPEVHDCACMDTIRCLARKKNAVALMEAAAAAAANCDSKVSHI